MKILSFGHIPSWVGGKQESGLANVIYQLAKHGSDVSNTQVVLAATDCFVKQRQIEKLTIVGWTKCILVKYILAHPFKAMRNYARLKKLVNKYPYNERFGGLYFKRVFLMKTISEVNPDVVHLHGPMAVFYLDLIPSITKVAVTFHGMTGIDKNIPQYGVLYNMEKDVFHSKKVDECFFICTQLVDSFKKTYGDNLKRNIVIFNSYDNTQFYLEKAKQNPFWSNGETAGRCGVTTLCTVASLSDLKGQLRVLSGLTMLPNRNNFKYFCIGGGSVAYADELKKFAADNEIDFEYLGKMKPDGIREQLQHADYMIMPSSSEGFGLTYLEAIACGVPVILPKDIPIAYEHELINEKNSILLEDCSPESIAKILKDIDSYHFNHKDVALTIAGFSWDEIAKQYVNEFKII